MMRTALFIAAALALSALAWPDPAGAASCREQLEDFERRLYESALAANDPEQYAELSRQAEEISELRDEERCVERLAELSREIPEPAAPTTGMNVARPDGAAPPAPPAAPFLIDAAPAELAAEPATPAPAESPADHAPAAETIPGRDVPENENRN